MRNRRDRDGGEGSSVSDQNVQAADAADTADESAKQEADVTISGKTSADGEKQDRLEDEAQIDRVMPDAEGDSDQPLDQPTA